MNMQGNGWEYQQRGISFRLNGYRPGWRGVWDHFKNWASGKDAPIIETDHQMTIGFWVKKDSETKITGVTVTPVLPEREEKI